MKESTAMLLAVSANAVLASGLLLSTRWIGDPQPAWQTAGNITLVLVALAYTGALAYILRTYGKRA